MKVSGVKKYIYYLILLSLIELIIIIAVNKMGLKIKMQDEQKNSSRNYNINNVKGFETIEDSIVLQSDMVSDEYFKDALFIGDSRIKSLEIMHEFEGASFFADEGLAINNLLKKKIKIKNKSELNLLEMLDSSKFGKIYFQIGINDLAGFNKEQSIKVLSNIIDEIKKRQSNAIIYMQPIIFLRKDISKTGKAYNNRNINSWNEEILELAKNKAVYYININETISDIETNELLEEYSSDGININEKAVKNIVDYLKSHVVDK